MDEGDLKRSLKRKATVKRSGFGYVDIGPEKGKVFYGHIVESGSSQQSARPFLRPALDEGERRWGYHQRLYRGHQQDHRQASWGSSVADTIEVPVKGVEMEIDKGQGQIAITIGPMLEWKIRAIAVAAASGKLKITIG